MRVNFGITSLLVVGLLAAALGAAAPLAAAAPCYKSVPPPAATDWVDGCADKAQKSLFCLAGSAAATTTCFGVSNFASGIPNGAAKAVSCITSAPHILGILLSVDRCTSDHVLENAGCKGFDTLSTTLYLTVFVDIQLWASPGAPVFPPAWIPATYATCVATLP